MTDQVDAFLDALVQSLTERTFVSATLGKHRGDEPELNKVLLRPVTLIAGDRISLVYRYARRDVTKTLTIPDTLHLLKSLIGRTFLSAHLFTTLKDLALVYNKKRHPRLAITKATHTVPPSRSHNRPKPHYIPHHSNQYLHHLGVTTAEGTIKPTMQGKYRQINKFIEIVAGLLRASSLKDSPTISVSDMGSGKGYLTFALYDYLAHTLKKHVTMTGTESRKELVDFCNGIAAQVGFQHLSFKCGAINTMTTQAADIVLALHACDTATDDAIYNGITARSAIIVCAPCCQKELRPQMHCTIDGLDRVLQFGILAHRQADLVTDGVRALLLEACGYKVNVFEFISTEHSSKNIMITGIRTDGVGGNEAVYTKLAHLKQAFGIETQRLDALLSRNLHEVHK